MSGSWVMPFISVLLQYGILIFLFYFLWKMGKSLAPSLSMKSLQEASLSVEAGEAVVTILDGPEECKGRRFAFRDTLSIGRAEDNDIVLSDSFVSHHHVIFERVRTIYTIVDLGSANHTYLNGEALSERRTLKNGYRIRVGMITFLFER